MDHERAKIRSPRRSSSLMSPRKEFLDIKCAGKLSETRGDIFIYFIYNRHKFDLNVYKINMPRGSAADPDP